MGAKISWIDWRDTQLAPGKDGHADAFTIRECLNRILPENRVHALEENDWVVELLNRRFQQRFIKPLSLLIESNETRGKDEYVAVGFTIMAIASLMVETLACFRNGQWSTDNNAKRSPDPRWAPEIWRDRLCGSDAFEEFLTDSDGAFAPSFDKKDGKQFYSDIRCGILHQAETKGGWRIRKHGGLVEGTAGQRSINAVAFLEALRQELMRYVSDLNGNGPNAGALRKACRYKLLGVCVNGGWQGEWPIGSGQIVDWIDYSP